MSSILIALGVSLVLCADVTYNPEETARISEILPEAGSQGSVLLAEEAETEAEAPPHVLSESDVPAGGALHESEDISEAGALSEDGAVSVAVSAAANAGRTAGETVPEPPPAGGVHVSETDDYFSDALFIGDSRTQGLLLYSNLGNASYYAARGLTVEQVFKKPVVDSDGGKLTVSDALEHRAFGKVYLMFGLNELGWNSAEKFIETYGLVLDRVRETQPDAVIYVQAIMPVSARKSEKDPVHNNPNIDRFNEMILRLAEEKSAIYLDVGESVADGSGVLPDEASSDGIHLNKKYCIKWEEYLRTHEV